MARKLWVVLALVALVAAACKSSTDTDSGSADTTSTQTIHVVEHADTDVVIDTGKPGDSTGDLLTFHNNLYDESNQSKVGTDQGQCTRIDPKGGTWECIWTVSLDEGQITVEGPFDDNGPTTLAITGGTGGYEGARGQMDLEFHNPKGTEFDFIYHIST